MNNYLVTVYYEQQIDGKTQVWKVFVTAPDSTIARYAAVVRVGHSTYTPGISTSSQQLLGDTIVHAELR